MTRKKATALRNIDLGDLPNPHDNKLEAPLLSMEEMKEIEAQAIAEVQKELKEKLRGDYLAKTKSALKKKALFVEGKDDRGESIERILIDLPKFSDRITLDGVVYFHNASYSFTAKKAATIRDIIYRQWLHHAEISGLDMNELFGRRKYQSVVRPAGE